MIEILLLILGLLAIGSYKKDFTTLIFAGLGFTFYGLMIVNGLLLDYPYNLQFGVISILYGIYLIFRSSLDLLTFKKEVKR